MTPCYIFDIDGTLSDLTHRLHFITGETKDWRSFYAACGADTPISHMIELCEALVDIAPILFVSGRSDECRAETEAWLNKHSVGLIDEDDVTGLYMRKAGDHREDAVVKMGLLADLRADGFEPIMVFEDRKRVVEAWRAAGIPCAQVAAGDF